MLPIWIPNFNGSPRVWANRPSRNAWAGRKFTPDTTSDLGSHRSGKTLSRSDCHRLARRPRGHAGRRNTDRLRLAAQGAEQRRQKNLTRRWLKSRAGRAQRIPLAPSAPPCAPATRPPGSGSRAGGRRTSWSRRPNRSTSCYGGAPRNPAHHPTIIVDEIHAGGR
jgi:hypothetical protein